MVTISGPEINGIKIAELFSGAGGFSAALGQNFRPFLAIDNDPRARQVYSRNRPNTVFVEDDGLADRLES